MDSVRSYAVQSVEFGSRDLIMYPVDVLYSHFGGGMTSCAVDDCVHITGIVVHSAWS